MFELGGLDVLATADDGNHDGDAAVDPAALAELRDHELAVAGADFDCRAAQFDETFAAVRLDLETEFVAQHRPELGRLRDWLAEHDG